MRRAALALFVAAAGVAAGARAQDADAPDLDFLEYLGSWQDGDEEWLVVADEFMGRPADDGGEATASGNGEDGAGQELNGEDGTEANGTGEDRSGEDGTGGDEDDEADTTDEN